MVITMTIVMVLLMGLLSVAKTPEADENLKPVPTIRHEVYAKPKPVPMETQEAKAEERQKVYRYYESIPLSLVSQISMQKWCDEYHVNYGIALAFMESESSFIKDANGDSGNSIGLMQINSPNWYRYGLDAHITLDNIQIGVRILSELIEKYGELDAVTMAYKGGEDFADTWIAEGKRLDSACDQIIELTEKWQKFLEEK